MKILVLATKSPWPAVDGGRQVLAITLEALVRRGHAVTLVFPASSGDRPCPFPGCHLVPVVVRRRSPIYDLGKAWWHGRPLTLERHSHPELRAKVTELLAQETFDVIHAEQVQALDAAGPAFEKGLPVVLRAQNVESELWQGLALRHSLLGGILRREAQRLAQAEGLAVARAAATVALTRRDAEGLLRLGEGVGKVVALAAPAPAELPTGEPLAGEPALVLFGGGAWPPNRDGARFFLREIWPRIAARFPRARVHVFGEEAAKGERVEGRPSPAESREAFPRGGILLVPLFIGSGVRMKILEAWARGLPVIATPVAARGLEARSGVELEIAEDPSSFAAAIEKLSQPAAARSAIEAGRTLLRQRHDPDQIAEQLEKVYREAGARSSGSGFQQR